MNRDASRRHPTYNLVAMIKHVILWSTFALWLVGLPLAGTWLAGKPVRPYLHIPPDTIWGKYPVAHPPFSWAWFVFYAAVILLAIGPLVFRFLTWRGEPSENARKPPCRFPWWGWTGIVLLIFGWYAEWARTNWIRIDHPPAFGPLWIGFILVVNALCCVRSGSCLMLDRPKRFLLLFPLGAGFWWFFEYLNRYVQNWQYIHVRMTPAKYFVLATVAFSTVLPGVLSVCHLLRTFPRFEAPFKQFRPIRPKRPRVWAFTALVVTGGTYALLGVFPNQLCALLWVSPVVSMAAIQSLLGQRQVFSDVARGDWRLVVSAAAGALLCGLFWEMWNSYSYAKWVYEIPYIYRFKYFEMPALGLAGYLPFGLECMALGLLIFKPDYLDPALQGETCPAP